MKRIVFSPVIGPLALQTEQAGPYALGENEALLSAARNGSRPDLPRMVLKLAG
jgi:hypothetical protein